MEKKWTPGPWFIREDEDTGFEVRAEDGGREPWHICNVSHGATYDLDQMANWKANAHLISAAHELYEALYHIVEFARADGWDKATSGRQILLKDAEQALAKARGE